MDGQVLNPDVPVGIPEDLAVEEQMATGTDEPTPSPEAQQQAILQSTEASGSGDDRSIPAAVASDVSRGLAHELHPAALAGRAVDGIAETLYTFGLIDDDAMETWRAGRDMAWGASRKHVTGTEDEAVTGAIVGEVAQIAAPGGVLFKGLRATGLGVSGSLLVAEGMGAAMGLDPDDPVLANLIPEDADHTTVKALRAFLATDPDDPEAWNRARRAAEIMGLGFTAEKLMTISRAARHNADQSGEELFEETAEVSPELDAEIEEVAAPRESDEAVDDSWLALDPDYGPEPDIGQEVAKWDVNKLYDALKHADNPREVFDNFPMNLDKFDEPEYLEKTFEELALAARGDVIAEMDASQTLAEISELATDLGMNPRRLSREISRDAEQANLWASRLVAGKKMESILAKRAQVLAEDALAGKMTGEEFISRVSPIYQHLLNVKIIQRGHARATSAGRIAIGMGDEKWQEMMLSQWYNAAGNPEELAKGIKRMNNLEPTLFWRIFNRGTARKAWMVSNEIMINGLLSSPKTALINFAGNFGEAVVKPLELAIGGTIRGAATGDWTDVHRAAGEYMALRHQLKDSFRAGSTAWRTEQAVLDPGNRTMDFVGDDGDMRVIKASQKTDANGDPIPLTTGQNAIDWIGKTIRLPSRGLLAADEVFKQSAYRQHVWGKAWADMAGKPMTWEQKIVAANKAVDEAFDPQTQLPKDPEALQAAREKTFTEDLLPGSIGKTIQTMADTHPWARSLVPFVRTPVNLFLHQYRRMPGIGLLSRQTREMWVAGGAKRSELIGRQAWGTMAVASFWMLASEGRITGQRPVDRSQAQTLQQSGWKPYSYMYTDKNGKTQYLPLDRMDPRLGAFMGIIADAQKIFVHMDPEDKDELMGALIMTVTDNAINRTYLGSLAETIDAMTSDNPEQITEMLAKHTQNRIVPFSSAMRTGAQVTGGEDQYTPEIRGYLDQLKRGMPGFGLPAKRNMFGEKVQAPTATGWEAMSPWQTSELDDRLMLDMANLGRGFDAPPPRWASLPGLDLRDLELKDGKSLYEAWMERYEAIRLDGMNVRQAVTKLVKSKQWQALPDDLDPNNPDPDGKIGQIQRVLRHYRKEAQATFDLNADSFRDDEDRQALDMVIEHSKREPIKRFLYGPKPR